MALRRHNEFTELATNAGQRDGPIVFGVMLVSLLHWRVSNLMGLFLKVKNFEK